MHIIFYSIKSLPSGIFYYFYIFFIKISAKTPPVFLCMLKALGGPRMLWGPTGTHPDCRLTAAPINSRAASSMP